MATHVRRLTPPRHDPRLEIVVSEAAECLSGLGLISNAQVRCDSYEVGCGWFDKSRTMMSAELRQLMAPLLASPVTPAAWHALLGILAEASPCMPALLHHLEAMPADDLWLQLLGFHDRADPTPELREAMLEAGHGRTEPMTRLLTQVQPSCAGWLTELARALGADANAAQQLVVAVLAGWHEEVFSHQWPEIAPILELDAAEKRRLASERPVADVVEEATNGGEYAPEAGIGRLLLIPNYLVRPWVTQDRQGDTLVISYPVGEAALTGSPDEARRRRVLRLARALSDDTRLRALRRLAVSSCTLQELADELGVRKSTMHHHVAALRSAGLLRLRFGEKRYSLRTSPLAEMSGLLGDYLGAAGARSSRPQRRRAR